MVKITINRLRRNRTLSSHLLKRIIKRTLESQAIYDGEVNLLIAGDSQIKEFNRKFLNRKGPTDVLAFSMQEGKRLKGAGSILGDVIISVDRVRVQAKRFKSTVKKELALYAIHGILHLTGFKDGSKKMKKVQQEILSEFFET